MERPDAEHKHPPIVVFDGVCNLCESSVWFVVRRDSKGRFKFVAAQSPCGQALQNRYKINALEMQTLVLLKNRTIYTKSDAAVEIARKLDSPWHLLALIKWLPRSIRDWAYTFVATRRYQWFGKKATCLVPDADLRGRFLEEPERVGILLSAESDRRPQDRID
jgi:predicted DCC family thiol-disulfide oxidoreductase YuxK